MKIKIWNMEHAHLLSVTVPVYLTIILSSGKLFYTFLFPLYTWLGFHSESKQPKRNRVKLVSHPQYGIKTQPCDRRSQTVLNILKD